MISSSSCSSSADDMKRQRAAMLHRGSMPQKASMPPPPPLPKSSSSPTPPTTDAMAFGCFTAAVAPRFFAAPTSERGKKESAAAILRALAALQHETEQVPNSTPPPSIASTPTTRSHHPQHRAASATEAILDPAVSLAPLTAMSAHESRNYDPVVVSRPPMAKRLSLRRGMQPPAPAVAQRWRRGHRVYCRGRSGTSTDIGATEGSHSGKDFKMIKRQEIPQDLMMIMEDDMPPLLRHQAYDLESSECSDSFQVRDTGSETTEDDAVICAHMHRADMPSEVSPNKIVSPVDSATETTYAPTAATAPDPTQILMSAVVLSVAVMMMVLVVGTGRSTVPSKDPCPGGVCADDWTDDEVANDEISRSVKSTPTWGFFSQGDRDKHTRSPDYPEEDTPQYDDEESDEVPQNTKGRYPHQHPYKYIASILHKKAFGSSRENGTVSVTS